MEQDNPRFSKNDEKYKYNGPNIKVGILDSKEDQKAIVDGIKYIKNE